MRTELVERFAGGLAAIRESDDLAGSALRLSALAEALPLLSSVRDIVGAYLGEAMAALDEGDLGPRGRLARNRIALRLGESLWAAGNLELAAAVLAVVDADALGDVGRLRLALAAARVAAANDDSSALDHLARADEMMSTNEELAASVHCRAHYCSAAGEVAFIAGSWDDAEQLLLAGGETLVEAGDELDDLRVWTFGTLATLLTERGDGEGAKMALDHALAIALRRGADEEAAALAGSVEDEA